MITVKSITPCVAPNGASSPEVEVVLFNEADLQSALPTIDEVFPVSASGTWSGQLTVPATAEVGEYIVDAACFTGPSAMEPFLIYEPQGFTVTSAAAVARPAVPIPGEPNFTG